MINGKHVQGTHSTKMGTDKLAVNTPNAPKRICPNCLPKPKRDFDEKRLQKQPRTTDTQSVVRGLKRIQEVIAGFPFTQCLNPVLIVIDVCCDSV